MNPCGVAFKKRGYNFIRVHEIISDERSIGIRFRNMFHELSASWFMWDLTCDYSKQKIRVRIYNRKFRFKFNQANYLMTFMYTLALYPRARVYQFKNYIMIIKFDRTQIFYIRNPTYKRQ